MITVSNAWKEAHQRDLLPEMFVEISCGITERGVQDHAVSTGINESTFSTASVVRETGDRPKPLYVTTEHNLWVLDGSRSIAPDTGSYSRVGYSNTDGLPASVTLTFDEPRTAAVPGVTITWSEEFGEYATDFKVTAKNGATEIAGVTVNGNTSVVSVVDLSLVDYDSVTIDVLAWCLPNHRARIEKVLMGQVMVFTKNEIIRYTHEQQGDLNSGEIPKNSIRFSLDNSKDQWNPHNPKGITQYLSERQQIDVRYGLDLGDSVEWITGGMFYLSEWDTPSNGLEASFVARDVFEFLLNGEFVPPTDSSKTAALLIKTAFEQGGLSADEKLSVDTSLASVSATDKLDGTPGEIIQMCSNLGCCIIRYDRDGILFIEPLNAVLGDYTITSSLSYANPELTLSKPLKSVSVTYGDSSYLLEVNTTGETQTVKNPLCGDLAQAKTMATWVRDTLSSRKTVSGEFRADPRLDLFDVVTVESKYGEITPVAITNIKYIYTGSFKASYTGRVLSGGVTNV